MKDSIREKINDEVKEKIQQMNMFVLNSAEDYQEGVIYEHTVKIMENDFNILVFKWQDKFYSTSSVSTYDPTIR